MLILAIICHISLYYGLSFFPLMEIFIKKKKDRTEQRTNVSFLQDATTVHVKSREVPLFK